MSGVIVRPGRGLFLALMICIGFLRPASADDIDDYVAAQMQRQHIPGLSLAVVREGKVVKSEGYGLASLELGAPATTASVFRIGSLTTQFTTVLTLMLAESGTLRLNDTIPKYISHTPPAWSKITVLDLLNQTSGIPDYVSLPQWRDAARPVSRDGIVRYLSTRPLESASAAKSIYSRTNYLLLGMILEKASGKSFATLLRERITMPLEMSATRLEDRSEIIPNRVSGYTHVADGGGVRNAAVADPAWGFSANSILATAADLTKWDTALFSGTLVKALTLDQLVPASAESADGSAGPYGLVGRLVVRVKGHRLVEDRAEPLDKTASAGFTSLSARFIDDNLTVVVLANADDANIAPIATGIASFYAPALSTASLKPIPDTEPQVTALLKDIFTKFAAGTGDPGVFTPDMWKLIQPSIENPARYKSLGAITSADLLSHEVFDAAGIRSYLYRVNYDRATLVVDMTLDKAGKVSSLRIRGE